MREEKEIAEYFAIKRGQKEKYFLNVFGFILFYHSRSLRRGWNWFL